MATNTNVALDKKTVSSPVAYVEFTGISSAYTDLVIIATGLTSGNTTTKINVGNGTIDTGSNYQWQAISSNGASTYSYSEANTYTQNERYANWTSTTVAATEIHIQNYASGYKKGWLSKGNCAVSGVDTICGTWNSTSAINVVRISTTNGGTTFSVGTTFSLYGIAKSSNAESTPKATGGYITSDASYWYHLFPATSTFVPNQSLTADVLIVAGGGSALVGGGGAGGVRQISGVSCSATSYTITVGAGGVSSTGYPYYYSANGTNSSALSYSATGGGGSGLTDNNPGNGYSGGSGGGGAGDGARINAGGTGNAGGYTPVEGYGGGASVSASAPYVGGGGGGAGGAGQTAPAYNNPGTGGIGATSALINAMGAAAGIGQFSNGNFYIGGGGAGGTADSIAGSPTQVSGGLGGGGGTALSTTLNGGNGLSGTGGGGGGRYGNAGVSSIGGKGGSGVVVIRYAK